MTGQLTLLPTPGAELRREQIPIEQIDGFAEAQPSPKLRQLIAELGLLQPIVVVPSTRGRFRVVEGRRRAKAIAQLAEVGEWPAPALIDALVLASADSRREEVQAGLTLALHATRSGSPASELRAIEAIIEHGGGEGEAATVREIAAQTGMSVQTVRRRLRLRGLIPALRVSFEEGRITAAVAEAAARLSEAQQARLAERLRDGGLSLPDVRELARQGAAAEAAELPHELFGERPVAWQATVRGHLLAAIDALPHEGEAAIRAPLTQALAELGRP
jgi:ParB-like chromosome segregation protein Spo0J